MSLGLPSHLASRVVSSGIARGAHTVAAICLLVSFVTFVLMRSDFALSGSTLVAIIIGALAVLLGVLHQRPQLGLAIVYVVGGAVALMVVTVVALSYPESSRPAADYLLSVLWIALVMVGGGDGGAVRAVALTLAALISGAAALFIGAAIIGATPTIQPLVPLAAALMMTIYLLTSTAAGRARRAQPRIHRAARDEKLAAVRSGVEARAAALLHDTVLGSLAAIAATSPGPLSPALRSSIEGDLDAIVGQDWTERSIAVLAEVREGPVRSALDEARALGLVVEVTGELDQLDRVSPEVEQGLALALRQLLVNVRLHSGVSAADVVIFADEASVSVMVVDAGDGFDPDGIAADRLGLRNSVIGRVERLGGSGKIWSSPGRGTSVITTVPALAVSAPPPAAPHRAAGTR